MRLDSLRSSLDFARDDPELRRPSTLLGTTLSIVEGSKGRSPRPQALPAETGTLLVIAITTQTPTAHRHRAVADEVRNSSGERAAPVGILPPGILRTHPVRTVLCRQKDGRTTGYTRSSTPDTPLALAQCAQQ